jgi:hypothetical protein
VLPLPWFLRAPRGRAGVLLGPGEVRSWKFGLVQPLDRLLPLGRFRWQFFTSYFLWGPPPGEICDGGPSGSLSCVSLNCKAQYLGVGVSVGKFLLGPTLGVASGSLLSVGNFCQDFLGILCLELCFWGALSLSLESNQRKSFCVWAFPLGLSVQGQQNVLSEAVFFFFKSSEIPSPLSCLLFFILATDLTMG